MKRTHYTNVNFEQVSLKTYVDKRRYVYDGAKVGNLNIDDVKRVKELSKILRWRSNAVWNIKSKTRGMFFLRLIKEENVTFYYDNDGNRNY